MKNKLFYIVISLLFISTSCMRSLEDEGISSTTTINGRLIAESTSEPVGGVTVQITNGSIIHSQCVSKSDGTFELRLDAKLVDENYYLLINEKGEFLSKKGKLSGFGRAMYSYSDIVLSTELDKLGKFVYQGDTIYVHKDLGEMTQSQASSVCDGLTYNGETDWFLPSINELNIMYINRDIIGGFSNSVYMSSTLNSTNPEDPYIKLLDFTNGSQKTLYSSVKGNVRCIRKNVYIAPEPPLKTISAKMDASATTITMQAKMLEMDYSERGFVYGTMQEPTIDNATVVSVRALSNLTFSATVESEFFGSDIYYVRSYVITSDGGIIYGEILNVQWQEAKNYSQYSRFFYAGYTYCHTPINIFGNMPWEEGKKACEDYVYAGYDDWYMPSRYELDAIYNRTNFEETWSSTEKDLNTAYYLNYDYYYKVWEIDYYNKSYALNVLCVRKE